MASVPLVTALLLLVALLASAAELSRLSAPVVLVLAGLAIGFVPGVPEVRVEPDVVFLLFLPPLLHTAAFKLAATGTTAAVAVTRRGRATTSRRFSR